METYIYPKGEWGVRRVWGGGKNKRKKTEGRAFKKKMGGSEWGVVQYLFQRPHGYRKGWIPEHQEGPKPDFPTCHKVL